MKTLALINTEVRQYRIVDPSTGETLLSGGPFRSYQHAQRQLMMQAGLSGAHLKWSTLWPNHKIVNVENGTHNPELEYFELINKIQEWDTKLVAMETKIPTHMFEIDDNTTCYIDAKTMIDAWHMILESYSEDHQKFEYLGIAKPRMPTEKPVYKDDEVIGEQLQLPF